MENRITEEMMEVLKRLRYDKETDTIVADCNLSCRAPKRNVPQRELRTKTNSCKDE